MTSRATCIRCRQPLPAGYDATRPCPTCLFALGLTPGEEPELVVRTGAGEPDPAPTPEELAPLFPQLEIQELLGQGGMGAVYRARQTDLDRDVALKILSPRVAEAAFAERFAREARALARLSHPNIVAVHDFGRAGPHYYLLMELIDGTNLRQLIHSRQVEPRQALEVVEQVCAALQYAHDQGVVHRDIKPENILVDRAGRVKIADFGLARMARTEATGERLTRTHQAMGTPQYMAPEQIEHPLEVDHRADIYSLGVVFYELLTGELPMGRFAPPSKKVQVDVRLDEVVLRALEKEPGRRYQQASEVQTDLEEIEKTPRHREPERGPAVAATGRHRRSWGWIVGLLLLVTLAPLSCAALLGVFFVRASGEAQLAAVERARDAEIVARESAGLPSPPSSAPEPGATAPTTFRESGIGIFYLLVAIGAAFVLIAIAILGLARWLHRRSAGSGHRGAWGWIVLVVFLVMCVPLSCAVLFLIPASVSGVSRDAAPAEVRTTPATEEPPPAPPAGEDR